jgi:hypothetical protein
LWDLIEEAKKDLGTPLSTFFGSGLGKEWKEEVILPCSHIWKLVTSIHPWLELSPQENFSISISQEELYACSKALVVESLSLAMNMTKTRLCMGGIIDKLDRFILSGFSCNLQVVQKMAKQILEKEENLLEFSPATVLFDQEVAKTSVAMGACIGRYLESVRLHPYDEKTKEALKLGYDQIELVVENLFNYLTSRLVYVSLVAMVPMFDYGLPFNQKSYKDRNPVARTPMQDLRPVQEKFWIYRVDFEGASPQYIGLINAEAACNQAGLSFREFRENYVVGFETDPELFVRAFFLPKGPKNILALEIREDENFQQPMKKYIQMRDNFPVFTSDISSQELFLRRRVLRAGTPMIDTIQYPDGSRCRGIISETLPIREMYDFYVEDENVVGAKALISHFHLLEKESISEIAIACDETGRVSLVLSMIYDIKIWADIDYIPQTLDPMYDPFCGQH